MFCNKCGANLPDGTTFCPNCGTPLANSGPVYPGYNPMQQPGYPAPVNQPGKGLAVAALVMGILSFLCFPVITGALGIIFGGVAKSKGYQGGMATAGIVCGAIGIALWLLMLVALESASMLIFDELF